MIRISRAVEAALLTGMRLAFLVVSLQTTRTATLAKSKKLAKIERDPAAGSLPAPQIISASASIFA